MANSKYEYVKAFELDDRLLPATWVVVRIDGRGFHKFSEVHGFEKPNDANALHLMNDCAKHVLAENPDIVFAYGASDEYSFVIHKNSTLFQRRSSKLVSVIVSLFAATYVYKWADYFPATKLIYPPCFDGRTICFPTDDILRDSLCWRQVDCHINNQYNTCYWFLRKSGLSGDDANKQLQGTQADFKNELLFTMFNINYSTLPEMFRKGSCVFRKQVDGSKRKETVVQHCDVIGDTFWEEHPYILEGSVNKEALKRSLAKKSAR